MDTVIALVESILIGLCADTAWTLLVKGLIITNSLWHHYRGSATASQRLILATTVGVTSECEICNINQATVAVFTCDHLICCECSEQTTAGCPFCRAERKHLAIILRLFRKALLMAAAANDQRLTRMLGDGLPDIYKMLALPDGGGFMIPVKSLRLAYDILPWDAKHCTVRVY